MMKDLIKGISVVVLLTLIFASIGCSANYHLAKFFKKGGVFEEKIQLVKFTDTLKINSKDSLIERWIPLTCPEPKAPQTKFEIRWKYKFLRANYKDSLAYLTKLENLKTKNHKQTEITNRKKSRHYKQIEKSKNKPISFIWWLILGAVLMLVIQNLVRFLLFRFGVYRAIKKDSYI